MALRNALGDIALDDTVVDAEKRIGVVAHYVSKIAGALGLATEPSTGRVRVNVEAGSVTVSGSLTTITTVTTVTNVSSVNGMGSVGGATINPGQQVFAGMAVPALELRHRIAVS